MPLFKNLTLKKILKEILSTLLIVFVFANIISYFKSPNLDSSALPLIERSLITSEQFSTKDYKGKALMVHIWATWCPVCKTEIGNIDTVAHYYDVITIASKSGSDEELKAFLKERGINFKVINDNDSSLAHDFSVGAYPTTFIYDKNGELAFSEVGYTSTIGLYLRMWWASL